MFRQLQPLVLAHVEELMGKISAADTKALLKGIAALEDALDLGNNHTP